MNSWFWKKGLVFSIILPMMGTCGIANSVSIVNTHKSVFELKDDSIYFLSDEGNNRLNPLNPSLSSGDEVDLLIITHKNFKDELQELVDHKNSHGIQTTLITTEEIYRQYSGIDEQEQIKYCIKDYLDKYHIKYVLLVGGLRGYLRPPDKPAYWYVPVRYSHVDIDGFPETAYLCDLYYADIYDKEGEGIFQTWDTAGTGDEWDEPNNIFGEWKWVWDESENKLIEVKDERDLVPDVAIGRLACRTKKEVKIMVEKIITYESVNHSDDCDDCWFNRMIVVGGDSRDDRCRDEAGTILDNGTIEGKLASGMALDWVQTRFPDIEGVCFWPEENSHVSMLDPNIFPENFIAEQSNGSRFTYLVGHGRPGSWMNYPFHGNFQEFCYIFCYKDFPSIQNGDMLPVVVVHACNAATFDKNLFQNMRDTTLECFCWRLTCKENGGSIATVGNTAINYGSSGMEFTQSLSGYMSSRFFKVYGNGTDVVGDIWRGVITEYVDYIPKLNELNKQDYKTLESWVLLGDPSLRIG